MNNIRKVWLKSEVEKLEIILPVTPFPKFKKSMTTTSQDLLNYGEIGTGATPKLTTWSCSSFFPPSESNYTFLQNNYKWATETYVERFTKWMNENHVVRFIYYNNNKNLNDYYCKITGFSHGEENGSKNMYYTLDFQEHKTMNLNGGYFVIDNDRIIQGYGSDTYYVGEGDTLISIAAKIFGDSTKWAYLMNQNNLTNPLDITVGQALKI